MNRFQRYDDEGWFRVRQVEVTTSILLAALAAISVVLWAISTTLFVQPFYLNSGDVRSGQLWRIVTYPLVNNPSIWIVLSIAMLVLVGNDIERELRRTRFLWLIGAIVVVPTIAILLFNDVVEFGIDSIVTALFVVYVLWRPGARSFFDIPLWVMVVVLEGIYVLQLVAARYWAGIVFWALGIVTAALMTRAFGITEFEQIPKIPLPQFVTGDPYQKANRARERAKGRGKKGAEGNVVPINANQRVEPRLDRADQADMDALLDKISEEGMASLNDHERRRLDQLSKQLRGDA